MFTGKWEQYAPELAGLLPLVILFGSLVVLMVIQSRNGRSPYARKARRRAWSQVGAQHGLESFEPEGGHFLQRSLEQPSLVGRLEGHRLRARIIKRTTEGPRRHSYDATLIELDLCPLLSPVVCATPPSTFKRLLSLATKRDTEDAGDAGRSLWTPHAGAPSLDSLLEVTHDVDRDRELLGDRVTLEGFAALAKSGRLGIEGGQLTVEYGYCLSGADLEETLSALRVVVSAMKSVQSGKVGFWEV